MKSLVKYCLLSVSLFMLSAVSFSQDSCKVLVPNLQGSYIGQCKKGLANGEGIAHGKDTYKGHFKKGYPDGKGTYIWADSSYYTGDWVMGKREGEGVYHFKVNGRDSVLEGHWKNDAFVKDYFPNPKVNMNKFVDSYNFIKVGDIRNRVLIRFMQNGSYNTRVENIMLNSDSGMLTQRGQLHGFEEVSFPVTISVRYDTYNKMGTRIINCFIEFTIYEPGDWEVVLKN